MQGGNYCPATLAKCSKPFGKQWAQGPFVGGNREVAVLAPCYPPFVKPCKQVSKRAFTRTPSPQNGLGRTVAVPIFLAAATGTSCISGEGSESSC
jgi:hypothetical protein